MPKDFISRMQRGIINGFFVHLALFHDAADVHETHLRSYPVDAHGDVTRRHRPRACHAVAGNKLIDSRIIKSYKPLNLHSSQKHITINLLEVQGTHGNLIEGSHEEVATPAHLWQP